MSASRARNPTGPDPAFNTPSVQPPATPADALPAEDAALAGRLESKMCEALASEAAGAQRRDEESAIELRAGVRLARADDQDPSRARFEFTVARASRGKVRAFRPGQHCRLSSDSLSRTVLIVGRNGAKIRVQMSDSDCTADGIAKARLTPATAWIVERLGEYLQAHCAAPDRFHRKMALAAIGVSAPEPGRKEPAGEVLAGEPVLHEHQEDAVRLALGSPVSYLWGPPGTGKTTTLARIVEAHFRRGRSVLLVAPTNRAVDEATNAIGRRLERETGWSEGLLLRLGPGATRRLEPAFRDFVLPARVRARLAARGPHLADPGQRARRQVRIRTTTVHQLWLTMAAAEHFDVVVIDEASMMLPPGIYCAAGKARTSVCIAGDFRQLPPISVATDPKWRARLGRDAFALVGIPDAVARDDDPPSLAVLTEQHRMAPDICGLVSSCFYGERLASAPGVRNRPVRSTGIGSATLHLLDTSHWNPKAERTRTKSRRNPVHADLICGLLDALLLDECGRPNPAWGPVAVLTPFVAQRGLLRRRLRGRYPAMLVPVLTVHEAQGSEYPTVVFDTVDAPGASVSRFLAATRPEDTGARLLNVGMSRAAERLVVVACCEFLACAGGPVVRHVLWHLWDQAHHLTPRDVSQVKPRPPAAGTALPGGAPALTAQGGPRSAAPPVRRTRRGVPRRVGTDKFL